MLEGGVLLIFVFFFFNDTAPTEISTLSLHDALPISAGRNLPLLLGAVLLFERVRRQGQQFFHSRSGEVRRDRRGLRRRAGRDRYQVQAHQADKDDAKEGQDDHHFDRREARFPAPPARAPQRHGLRTTIPFGYPFPRSLLVSLARSNGVSFGADRRHLPQTQQGQEVGREISIAE